MKLNYKRTFFIGLAFLSISSFWQLYDNIIPLMLKNTFGVGETLTGAIMAIDNVLALIMLPLFGALSDRVDTRLGKRTPFIIFGTFIAVICMAFLPLADRLKSLPMFFIALGMVLLAMSTYRSPAVALMPDLTPKPLRSKANAVINLMGAVGGLFALVSIRLFTVESGPGKDYTWVFLAIALLMIGSVAVLVSTIKEKKLLSELADELVEEAEEDKLLSHETDQAKLGQEQLAGDQENKESVKAKSKKKVKLAREVKKSLVFLLASVFLWFTAYNAVTTAFSRYAQEVWKLGTGFTGPLMVAIVAATLSFIPIGFISSKIGRKKTILAGICLMSASYFAGIWFANYSAWLNILFVMIGVGWASINVNSFPMVVEMSKGTDIGKYTGIYYTFSMLAQVFTPVFSGFLIETIGSYRVLFPYAVVFSILSFLSMLMVRHGDHKPEKKKDLLENLDVAD